MLTRSNTSQQTGLLQERGGGVWNTGFSFRCVNSSMPIELNWSYKSHWSLEWIQELDIDTIDMWGEVCFGIYTMYFALRISCGSNWL